MLLAAGSALAIVQPGDLGDDEETSAPAQETSTTSTSSTSTTVEVTTSVSDTTSTTVAGETTTTTVPGSGIGDGSTPDGGNDGVADTGMESMLAPGLALAALGLALRRAAARTA